MNNVTLIYHKYEVIIVYLHLFIVIKCLAYNTTPFFKIIRKYKINLISEVILYFDQKIQNHKVSNTLYFLYGFLDHFRS